MSYINIKLIRTSVIILLLNSVLSAAAIFAQSNLQNDPALIPWQHYTIKRLETQSNASYQNTNIIAFDNPVRKGLIDLAAADPATHYIFFITRFGTIYDSVLLNDDEYNQVVVDKKINPFEYAGSIYMHNIQYLNDAVTALRTYNKDAVNKTLQIALAIPEVSQAKSALERLIILEEYRKAFYTALGHINLPMMKSDSKNKNDAAEKNPGTYATIQKGKTTFTVYYNYDTLVNIAATMLNNSTGVIYIQNYQDAIVDSMQLNPSKINELVKSKINIFLLYRSWLEKQWQEQNEAMNELWKNNVSYKINADNTSMAVATVENTAASGRLQNIQAKLSAINKKIAALTMPVKELIQAQFAYLPVPGERMYIAGLDNWGYTISFQRGRKEYELTDHRGNVLATVSDKKVALSDNGITIKNYDADVVSAQDYYPGGMLESGRAAGSLGRYGFNGKEQDSAINGSGIDYDYGARILDVRIGPRFLSVDPLTKEFPWNSPYTFAENSPLVNIDLEGKEKLPYIQKFQSNGTWTDYPAAIDNGVINLLNIVPATWNSIVDSYHSLKRGTYLKDVGSGAKQFGSSTKQTAVNSIKYTFNTPVIKQFSDALSPSSVEIYSTLFFGFKLPIPTKGNLLRSLNKTVNASEASVTAAAANSGVLTIPQGLTAEEFQVMSQRIVNTVGNNISEDIVVQGSRASGTASITSDIDIAIKINQKQFDELIAASFGNPVEGSAKWKTMQHAMNTGKIQSGEAGLRGLRQNLEKLLGIEVDISIIRQGGTFDNGPQIPIKGIKTN